MKRSILLIFLLAGFTNLTMAQTMVIPANPQSTPLLLVGATAHIGNGQVIQDAIIGFDQGKLTVVGDATQNFDKAGYKVINVAGKHIYPGFILPATDLGLTEVSAVKATIDNDETGSINPNVRSIIAYNTDSELIPTLRFNGILIAQVRAFGGLISGSSSIVQLDAWNWEDALFQADDGIYLNWPNREKRLFDEKTFTFKTVPNENYSPQIRQLEEIFTETLSYKNNEQNQKANLKLMAMKGLLDGSKRLFLNVNDAKGIIEGVKFAKKMQVKNIVIVGGGEAYLIKDFLKAENLPVILGNVHSLPRREDDDVDLPYKMAYLLHQQGILTGLSYRGTQSSRNLPFFAGTTGAYGLGKEEALKLITSNTAKILGIDKRVGSLEVGKEATLFVSEGDALDMRTNRLLHAFINGRQLQLDATQQALYEKYKNKYQEE
ncbi:amidohydrolase family protein [Fulvivirgaceae bacterium BMA12]|uniref:Amidohydrolase family protein n=1 Tax=Agaribacillus aureus TaxID=3051825 RepID=A0ABT8L801_9BACT|nr:amidohydrolase family protein [Fulvivirgaceae bacterium BMA12]